MENKDLQNLELNDEEMDTIAGGASREIPQSGLCPMCGSRLRPVMAPLGSDVSVPKHICNSCGFSD